MHLIKEFFAVILVSNGDELFKVLRSNVLDQFLLCFCHSVPNLRGRPAIFRSCLTIEPCCSIGRIGNFSLTLACMSESQVYEIKGSINKMNAKTITLYKNLTKTSSVRGYQVGCLSILDTHVR